MKGFGQFDTTNTLYGNFYSRKQDPITNIPIYSKPNMEEEYYLRTLDMQKSYFNRYLHLYKDPTGKSIYNPIDGKAFKTEDAPIPQAEQEHPEQPSNINTIQRPQAFSHEMVEEKEIQNEPLRKTYQRNYEAEENKN